MLATAVSSIEALGAAAAGAAAFALLGWLLGRGVTSAATRLLLDMEASWGTDGRGSRRPSGRVRARFEIAAILLAIGLFAWEVTLGGLSPTTAASVGQAAWPRAVAHLVLFAFLAAAFWCDLEYRLIPDAITVPGTLLGMTCVTAWPGLLLPVSCELARDFAIPLRSADVLGAFGPLRCTAGSAWLGPAPAVAGLAAAVAAFAAWWLVCTAPSAAGSPLRDPRSWLLPAGLLAMTALWAAGGSSDAARLHFRAAEASLFGATLSGGIVWLIRAGASRALGREAMGLGDVTLMAMVGAWCGWQHGVLSFFMGAFIGLGQGAVIWLRHRDNELPYGPSLCLASGLAILAWSPLWRLVGGHFEDPLVLLGAVAGVVVLTAASLAVWARIRG